MDRAALHSIVEHMNPVDLKLYYPDGDQRGFWEQVNQIEAYKKDIEEIRQEGKRLLGSPNPELTYSLFMLFERQGTRLEYERVYFERRRRLNTFALLTLLEPERAEVKAALYDMICSICQEITWCLPAHVNVDQLEGSIDLFCAETGFTLSELLCLFGSDLPVFIRTQMETAITERLFKPFMEKVHHWETAAHNWSAVCAGSIGAAALLQLQDKELLTALLLKVEGCMLHYLKGFGSDGACMEGLGYWNYGFGYLVYYSDLLKQRSHGSIDWFQHDKVRRIALFQQKAFLGGSAVVNFSDTLQEGSVHLGLSHYLARCYESFHSPPISLRGAYTSDHCSRWAPAFRNLVWRNPDAADISWKKESYYLPDAQWLISRYQDKSGMDFGFAAKGGSNDEPHNHNDLGQFMLYGAGQVFITDLGCGEYTADYFGPARYSYDCNGSQGHTVPIINGYYQVAGAAHRSIAQENETSKDEDRLHLDLTKAYEGAGLVHFARWFRWSKNESRPILEVRDHIQLAAPGSVIERFVTTCELVCTDQGGVLLHGETDISLQIIYNNELLQPIVQKKLYRDHYGQEASYNVLDFVLKRPEKSVTIVFTCHFVIGYMK